MIPDSQKRGGLPGFFVQVRDDAITDWMSASILQRNDCSASRLRGGLPGIFVQVRDDSLRDLTGALFLRILKSTKDSTFTARIERRLEMRDPLSKVRIKYKLTGAFVGICLLAFGVGGYLISVSAGSALEREISLRLKAEGVALARELSARLHLLGRRAEDFASDGFIRTRTVDLLIQEGADAASREGSFVYHELREHLAANKFPLVQPLAGLALCDAEGRLLCYVGSEDVHLPAALLREGAVKDSLWCSPFITEDPDGGAYFALVTPLWDIARIRRLGALLFWVDVSEWTTALLQSFMQESLAGLPEHLVSISDQRGRRLPLRIDHRQEARRQPSNAAGITPSTAGTGGSNAAASQAQTGPDVFSQDHAIEGHGWRVHVSVNPQQAMLPVSGLQSSFLAAGILIAIVSLILLYFPVRFLVKPLAAMSDAAKAMSAGDFSQRVEEEAEDEIGDLARSFNMMAEATQERTERLQNTARLLEQQRRELGIERDLLNTVVHSMDDAVLYYDRDGRVVLHNAAAAQLHGEFQQRDGVLQPRRCGCDTNGERDCRSCLLDHRMPTRDCQLDVGDHIYEIVSSSIASQGGLEGTVLVGRDITHRQRIDEKQAHQDRLAVLGEVSAVMAHELNNPLAAISMFAQMMKKDMPDDAGYAEHLDVILRNTDSCKRTIRYLLSYSRDESAQDGECNIHELLPDVVRFLRPLYEKENVCFDLDLNAEQPIFDADETWLRQVFVNLVMNALQAMSCDGGRITLQSSGAVSEGHIVVDIIDTGPGIPRQHQEAVFEPFFTSKPSGKGTGLGLSISRRIIQSLDGTLDLLSSRPGQTVFRVSLPRVRYANRVHVSFADEERS
jgi:two-component system, NtrC family, sensor kinase